MSLLPDVQEAGKYILDERSLDRCNLGGKAASLAQLAKASVCVPRWFVLSPQAFWDSLDRDAVQRLCAATAAQEASAIFENLSLSEAVHLAVNNAIQDINGSGASSHGTFAVRSSAVDEDGVEYSFAGLLDSFLQVPAAAVVERVKDVWRSGFSERVYAYRRQHALSLPPPVPAVLIQKMVAAEKAGVAFGADPVSGRRNIAVISAVPGLGDTLVSGEQSGETVRVALREQTVERETAADYPVLTDGEAVEIARVVSLLGRTFYRPQDMEWALEQGALYVLQSRPITTLADMADPDGIAILWDNSNIIESYGGITTPLTYTFARRAYTEVYQEFCRILGVPEQVIDDNQPIFSNMIGFIHGRIYYNLLNWYRVLAMLPGFQFNRSFMEQMMGVREALPDAVVSELAASTWRQRMIDGILLGRSVLKIVAGYMRLPHRKRKFLQRLQRALGEKDQELYRLRADELLAYYRELDGQLLHKWDAPLLNDFYAMIFYGVLRKLVVRWGGDQHSTLQNDLLADEGGMISAEPARLIEDLAHLALEADKSDPGFSRMLAVGEEVEAARRMQKFPEFRRLYALYLHRFGERCLNELKLESLTLVDDARPLLRAIGNLALHLGRQPGRAEPTQRPEAKIRQAAEQTVERALAKHPLRRLLFGWVVANTRVLIRDRENLRFERTRVFGRARQIFREIGARLYAVNKLHEPHDIFFLTLEEIIGFVEGTSASTDLSGLATLRKKELAAAASQPAPPSRFQTYGMVNQGNTVVGHVQHVTDPQQGGHMRGIGCCPGRVRGRARVVHDPLEAQFEPGDILVAEHTDPSWIMIMPQAAGILVERGSLLSHAAIVARELGIPAVVSLAGITNWLRDGDIVELDGRTGDVHKLAD